MPLSRDGDRDGVAIRSHGEGDRLVLAVVDSVGQEVAGSVRRGADRSRRGRVRRTGRDEFAPVSSARVATVASAPSMGMAMSMRSAASSGHAGVVAGGDLRQFGEQGFESVEFFVEEFDGSFVHGVELVAGF